jgi:DNA-binding transcriptional MerR regulator
METEELRMAEKEKDIFKDIGDSLKEIGEDLIKELEKGELKVKSFEQAVQPSLSELGEKLKDLGKVLSPPSESFSQRFKEWKNSVKPVIDDMGDRVREWKKKEKEKKQSHEES